MSETFDRSQYPPITEIGDYLRANPSTWRDVPENYRAALEYDLMPYSVNDPAKAGWVRKWWLRATPEAVVQINAALPDNVRVSGRELTDGNCALSCDLLSDSKPGQTYEAAREIIESLVLIHDPEFVPPPVPDMGLPGATS